MAFDRELFKKKSKEGRLVAKTKKDHFTIEKKLRVVNRDIPDEDINRITVDSIGDEIDNLYRKGFSKGKLLNSALDTYITWEPGQLLVGTGIPSHGKSEFIDFVFTKLNILHGWKVMFYSPENYPTPYHYYKIAKKIYGKHLSIEDPFYTQIKKYINNNFSWIYYERNTVEIILKTAQRYIDEYGIKVLIIDPYNMVDSSMLSNESETLYINRFLDLLVKFAKKNDILVVLIAHPTKMQKEKDSKKHQVPTMYSISGSAHFYNKADMGLTVHRQEGEDGKFLTNVEIHIEKMRRNYLGERGMIELGYNKANGRYSELRDGIPQHDNSNWLDLIDDDEEED